MLIENKKCLIKKLLCFENIKIESLEISQDDKIICFPEKPSKIRKKKYFFNER